MKLQVEVTSETKHGRRGGVRPYGLTLALAYDGVIVIDGEFRQPWAAQTIRWLRQ